MLTAEGISMPSERTVRNAVRGGWKAKGPRKGAAAPAAPTAPREPTTEDDPQPADVVAALQRVSETLEGACRSLDSSDPADARLLSTLGRSAAAIAQQIQRMTPPAPVDPNAHPDMLAAADRGRAKLWEYVERLRAGTL